jgi:hypothetical protein
MAEQLQVDWSTAEVSDGQLTVGFSAKPPKKWRAAFERTAALLSSGTWEVTLAARKGVVEVRPVSADDEERVRQLVEGAVLEANSAIVSESELYGTAAGEDDQNDEEDSHERDEDAAEPSPDEELTTRFRAYADEEDA